MIEHVVNAHGGVRPTSGELAALNLLAILRIRRRLGKDFGLRALAAHPECLIDPKKRAAFARKWADRIERNP